MATTSRIPCTLSCSLGDRTRNVPTALFNAHRFSSQLGFAGSSEPLRIVRESPAAIVQAVKVEPGAVTYPEIVSIAAPMKPSLSLPAAAGDLKNTLVTCPLRRRALSPYPQTRWGR